MLKPKNEKDDAIILEFKVLDGEKESGLEETVVAGLTGEKKKQQYLQN